MIGGEVIAKAPRLTATPSASLSPRTRSRRRSLPKKSVRPGSGLCADYAGDYRRQRDLGASLACRRTSLAALVKLAKAQPGKLSFGLAGAGTGVQSDRRILQAGRAVLISRTRPTKAAGPSLADLVAGPDPGRGAEHQHDRWARARRPHSAARYHQPRAFAGAARTCRRSRHRDTRGFEVKEVVPGWWRRREHRAKSSRGSTESSCASSILRTCVPGCSTWGP